MKNPKHYLFALVLLFGVSCDDDESLVTLSDMSPAVQEFMILRGGPITSLEITNPIAVRHNPITIALSAEKYSVDMSTWLEADLIYHYRPWEIAHCGTSTTTFDDEGGRTTIFDRGEGCETQLGEIHYVLHGKATLKEKLTTAGNSEGNKSYSFAASSVYENYGGESEPFKWNRVGKINAAGHAIYNAQDRQLEGDHWLADSLNFEFNGKMASYQGRIESTFSNTSWTVERNDFRYTQGENLFVGTLLTDLIYYAKCEQRISTFRSASSQYASGKEKITYRHNGVEGSFVIDYGNGFSDDIIYVTEGGKKAKIDLSARYELY